MFPRAGHPTKSGSLMSDQLTKDAKAEAKKRRQEIGFLIVMIGVFGFTSYSLFEAF
jgi:hypothetical protein